MRTKTINKDRPEVRMQLVKNKEASASIPYGTPVIYKMDGTEDGIAVVKPSSSTAVKATSLLAGIVTRTIAPNEMADAVYSGFYKDAIVSRGTRAASTDAWPSFAAIALGDQLVVDTVANALALAAVGAASKNLPGMAFADTDQTAASTTTGASDAYTQWAGALAATFRAKVIIRIM